MRKIKLPVQEITQELVIDLINEHSTERNRILKLKRYFNNENEIVNRNYIDKNKPMNKLSHNYAAMITNSFTGYFLGKPVSYKSDNEGLLEQLNDVFMYNDEADVNTSIGEEASICGYAYELNPNVPDTTGLCYSCERNGNGGRYFGFKENEGYC